MIKKSKQLNGMSIVETDSGKIIGKTKDTIFLPGRKKILGFTVCSGKWVKGIKILQPDNIENIGVDMITIKNGDILSTADKTHGYEEALKETKRVAGIKVITNSGEEMGFFQDIIVNTDDCSIEGYVLTDGPIEDILRGKIVLPFSDNIIFGRDAIIVESSSTNLILKNDISLKKTFERDEESGRK